jgi:Tfp pilus assembly protein PilF
MTQARTGVVSALCAGLLFALAAPLPASADDDGPAKPRIDCTKEKNKNKPACKPHHAADDAVINGAYWLARNGRAAEALVMLQAVQDWENPRALNAKGFATRKAGDVDGALPYYGRALALDPDYVQAREYLGEAFLTKGDVTQARLQLGEIERRCGSGCVAFVELERQITAFETARETRG